MLVNFFTNDKEILLRFSSKILGLNDSKAVANSIKLAGKESLLPFNVEHFAEYVWALTGRPPCPVCGGPTYQYQYEGSSWRYTFAEGGGVCWRSQAHNFAYWHRQLLKITFPDLETDDDKMYLHLLGGACEHNLLMAD